MGFEQGTQGKVRECLFNGNMAEFGGALFRGSTTGDVVGCVFLSNKASKIGGAIYDSHVQACPLPASMPYASFNSSKPTQHGEWDTVTLATAPDMRHTL
jgi:hypothetical protein